MGTRSVLESLSGLLISLILISQLIYAAHGSKVWGEVAVPEDMESHAGGRRWEKYLIESDDEDFAADEASGDLGSGEDGSTTEPTPVSTSMPSTIYYRALVNFTKSLRYGPQLEDIYSEEFQDISDAVVDTLESEYSKIPGNQDVSVVLIKLIDGYEFVELDVGSDFNINDALIRSVLYSVVEEGSIGSYSTSVEGFQFRRLGVVIPRPRQCMSDEFACGDGECILLEYRCDNRADCRDMSDETGCDLQTLAPPVKTAPPVIPTTTVRPVITPRPLPPHTTPRNGIHGLPGPVKPTPSRPCRVDEAVCQSGQCILRDYLCDGERDCGDGSDELNCGTPSPCEPNEFKCRNGRCALKLWRCDGDNDCGDNSDEEYCPTKGPGDTCAPDQFICVTDRVCIPASYQCDEEADCSDRSDEYGCTPPQVTSPPEETITAVRGETVTFSCSAVGVPTPIITWRLNWGHIPASARITMSSKNGQGTLVIRDVKDADQGAYTCEAINAKGMVFGIPDGVLMIEQGPCPGGHFSIESNSRCVSCFCFGITKSCQSARRYRNQIRLRFTEEDDFKGVNISLPSKPVSPPLTSSQILINPEMEEFQLLDLSRRFLNLESFWTLPNQFLGNKIDSYGGTLKYKVRYTLARGQTEPEDRPDVVIVGNGQKLIYRRRKPTPPNVVNQQEIQFTEENWEHKSGAPVSRGDLMMTLVNLEGINIRTVYDNKMVSVGLSDIVMDTTTVEYTNQGLALSVEECRCPPGYTGLSCESCAADFERVSGGAFLGSCSGCNCNGHASTCDPVGGRCLSCQHNTEGPQCDKCRPGFFGDPTRGHPDDCKPCPCPYTETTRRFSATCFLDTDGLATCDACYPGYTGRRCEKCAAGYDGNPLQPGGKCIPSNSISKCDNRGTVSPTSRHCLCKPNVVGTLCDECKTGFFHLKQDNPDGCLQCFCMGVTKQCASSSWNREQVRAADNGQEFTLSNSANTRTISEGIILQSSSELTFRSFSEHPTDVYYWVLPERFRGDKVTSYGGELQYTVLYNPRPGSPTVQGKPDVTLQGNGIFLEHFSDITPIPRVPTTITVPFRESAWRRADGQPSTREHLLMALADTSLFMIRATYADRMTESSISNIHMDIAVPYPTGQERAAEVEDCACPPGYRGPSCQDCDVGYVRTGSGLYLGTCERCNCNGHSSECDLETGECQQCQHNTAGPHCEICKPGFYGDPKDGSPEACRPCPCPGTSPSTQFSLTCFLDTDGQPTCDNCPASYAGRRCERCAAGYSGNPLLGRPCSRNGNNNGNDCRCDPRGSASDRCDANGQCLCKMHTEGPTCSSCKLGHFHLSAAVREGCLPCFCMGVTQQCISSSYYRDLISTSFSPGNFQNFALVNRQRSTRIVTGISVEVATDGTQLSYSRFGQLGQEALYWQLPENLQGDKYALVYKGLSLLPDGLFYWQLPQHFKGDKIGSYGGRLRYTLSYNAGVRGSPVPDADVQIIGNDITLVSYHPEQLRPRERKTFEVIFREQYWKRPDGMQATREHLMMVLADLDEILVRASYSTDMLSTSISGVSMEVAVPTPTSLPQALEVEQCGCPPGYQGLSCQDCAPGYTRTGGGLYLGHCELCDCNGHSDSCHPETGVCTSCLHNTFGQMCEQCASGFYGDPTAGTPEDCQRCACPLPDPESQFSPTCESQGSGYRCTACQPGFTGQYCERCATGYVGKPLEGTKCRPFNPSPLVVQVYPERTVVSQDSDVTLRCQVTGTPPHYFYWTRTDGRALPSSAHTQRDGKELHFSRIQPNDAGVYVCTCRDLRNANTSRAEIIVTAAPSKAIEVTVEEPKEQSVSPGSTVSFICTARSKSPAYTLVWTRQNNGKLPDRAMDFNGILTIHNVQPEDAGLYVCTGSNMFDMDEGTARLYVAAASQTRMFYQAYEMLEGHRAPVAAVQPVATISPPVLTVQQGQRAEFRCTVTGNPPPAIEWFGGQGNRISPNAIIQGGVLQIPTVERSDEAEYICRALNIHGEHSARAVLYVHSASLPHVQVSPQRIEVSEGEPVRLYCRAGGTPSPALTWKKLDGELPQQARTERTDIGTLVIPSAKASDAGVYLCVGTNSIGSSEGRIEVSVHSVAIAPFSVTIQPSPASVQEGKSLDLNCIVRGAPAPSITWHRSGGPLASNHQVIGPQLRILQATSSDSGEYICRASSIAGVQQATVSVSITDTSSRQQSPIISIEPHSASVIQGQSASFRCRVYSGAQPIRIEWKMANNQPLLDNVKMTQDGSVITISNTHHGNQGAYRCVASNPFGITHSIVSLLVQAPPTVSVTPQGPVRVKVGEPINLECLGMGEPRPAVSWRRVDSAQRVVLQSPVPMDSKAVMQVLAARPEDAGTYTCVARNPVGSAQKQVEVVVEGGSVVPTTPKVSVAEPMVIAVERGTATLRCTATGYPIPTITWSKLRAPLPWQHKVVNNSLVIPNLGRQDSGQYICNATNAAGTSEITIMLDVESPPYATFLPNDLTVRVGEVIRLQCLAHGTHPLQYQWSKLNGTLPTRAEVQEGTLQINLATAADSGTYKCVVKNNVGTSDTLAKVNVIPPTTVLVAPPTVSVTPQGPVRVKVGEPINLECLGMGEPRPAVSWRRVDSAQRVVLQSPVPMDSNAVMQVLAARPEDAGTYTCVARNPVGSAQKQVVVVVEGGSVVPTIPKVSVAEPMVIAVERGTATLRCTATGYPIPTITWSKLRAPLPWQHKVVNNSLVISNLGRQDSGQYICNATNAAGTSEITIMLDVESPPYATFLPNDLTVRVGEVIRLQCLAHGTHPLQYQWSKVNGTLPTRAEVQEGTLQINLATAADSGTYKCVVKNNVGTSDTLAKVNVIQGAHLLLLSAAPPTVLVAPPTVSVTPQGPVRVKVGEPINLECLGMGEPRPAVSWRRVDSAQRVVLQSPVPMDSNAVMQVLAARPEDAGTYTCVARNPVGSAQKQVVVVVEGGSVVPTIPKVSVAAPMVIAVERGTATLRCTATGYPIPTITWSKLRAPLPWQHKVVNNSLVIPNLGQQDSGQYICNATNAAGTSEITIMLDVESPPYATFLPNDLTVRVGEVIRLQCLAHGTHPLQYQWSKVNGTLPTRAEVQEGTLQINLATAADSGTYKCVVKNNVGTSNSLAKVNVRSPLSVRVSPQIEVKGRGSTVEFTCSATGGAKTRIEWLKEGGSLPPNHHVDNGVLRIENLEQDNEGVYVCRATNMFGQAQDSGKLTIQALPKVMINVRTSVQTVMLGNQVEFECQAIGDPQPTVTWSKVNGRLPSHIIVQGGMLKIEQVKEADAGHYRCTATNAVGSVQSEVVLNVQSIPQIAAQPKVKEVTVGSTAVFPCMASGYPAPDIKWTKMEGNLPQSARVEDHVLTISAVTPEHSGTYICTASNKQGKVQAFSVLTVRERVVPYFTQTPLSYLTLPTIKNAYKTFNIKITFRPDTADGVILYAGMIIYNGQKKTTGADFISFGLVGGRPEFRFDVGSGMATIRYPTSIKLGEFHTVVLYRNQTQGAIVVDDHAPVNGSSQGKFQGLDLNEELHVGGYPDFAVISKTTGLKSGFVGCIRQLIIQGDEVIFKDLDQSSTGISNCPTCTDQPCQNGGVCEDSETSSYICDCPIGFTGSNCEHYSALHCHPEACGPDATCINRHNGLGYDCRCHLGKSGDKCMEGILVTSPSFNGEDSYVSYPPMTIVHNDLRMDLEFKTLDSDGLLFFSGGKKMKVEDFVSLAMVDGHVEFRFELGTGMAVLRSPEPVALGRWHRIMAERSSKDGTLRVDHQKEIKRSSPGKAQGLNIHTPMYLGGVPNMAILPKPANISRLFHGCIGELSINGKKVDISYSFTDSRNIAQCYDESPCDRMPCLHGGSCLLTGEFEYQCICRDGYEGDRCEIFKDMCLSGNPCKNGGSCSKNQCVCPLGFTGQFCEKGLTDTEPEWHAEGSGGNDSPIQYSAYFHDDGYMALPKPMFPRSSPEAPETIVLEARTTSADGLILWQGVEPNGASHELHDFNEELGEDGKSKDFVSLGLQDGHLVFSYQLGSGEAIIVSEDPINDGDWHKITAMRAGRVGSIQIDGDDIVTGESGGTKVMVNTQGNIYLGGAPDIFTLTGGKFSSGVTGCIRNVMLMNARPGDQPQQPIDLQVHAEEGVHVEKCPS
ncbi:basement membrane-specific heparan sulfate proteoglycan core protein-like isoform X4 [Acipenser ruthenus]|uniref:basement membrane-specific heparan sulfate proteoglycan core protein-like isoform X4 n=1 Tax=Acipenser ruthenus TaxID=7906 RepID=UPI002742080A|nr:basement membrane-specific heparan sulfate proteoglycan core protein-like isoform X4 [Acipenser ruthenus]